MRRAELVDRMVVIGANFHCDGVLPLELGEDSPISVQLFEAYEARSPDGSEYFETLFGKLMEMVTTEPTLTVDDLTAITAPTLVLIGDDDLLRLAHTCELYEALPAGQLCVVPGTSHALPIERPIDVARIVRDFLSVEVPPPTLMPIRRATTAAH